MRDGYLLCGKCGTHPCSCLQNLFRSTSQAQQDAESIAALKEEVAKRDAVIEKQRRNLTEAEKEIERLKQVLIKTPKELNTINQTVQSWTCPELLIAKNYPVFTHDECQTRQEELASQLSAAQAQLAESEKERAEQARLLGISGNRELRFQAQVEMLKGALEWYANEDNHIYTDYGSGLRLPDQGDSTFMQDDCGLEARTALAQLKSEEGGK